MLSLKEIKNNVDLVLMSSTLRSFGFSKVREKQPFLDCSGQLAAYWVLFRFERSEVGSLFFFFLSLFFSATEHFLLFPVLMVFSTFRKCF